MYYICNAYIPLKPYLKDTLYNVKVLAVKNFDKFNELLVVHQILFNFYYTY